MNDGYFTAKSGTPSPLKDNAAPNNGELGMYGGFAPYQLSGLTNVPAVYEIQMPMEVPAGTFDVTVKVIAH
jgi:hypothetical protein